MPNGRSSKQTDELWQAVKDNNIQNVKVLLQKLPIPRKEHHSPFRCMAGKNNVAPDFSEFEFLILEATKQKDTSILEHFIALGANVNFSCDIRKHDAMISNRITPIHLAIKTSGGETVEALLGGGANVNATDSDGRTPLHYAIEQCDTACTRQLLFKGAVAAVVDKSGTTPLQVASRYGHVELVKILLEHDAQVFQRGQRGYSPLHIAAAQGHVPLIDMFCRYVDVNICCTTDDKKEGKSPLHLASQNGLLETVKFLVEKFAASLDILDNDGRTPLHCTLSCKHNFRKMRKKEDFDMIVEYLLKKRANVDECDNIGNTPLFYAAQNQFHKAAELLLMSGANPDQQNDNKQTPRGVIEEYDATMSQIFMRNLPFSSPYINLHHISKDREKQKSQSFASPQLCSNETADTKSVQIYKTVVRTN